MGARAVLRRHRRRKVWGRGASDTKCSVMGFFQACEELLRENRADRMRLLSAVDVLVDGPFRSHERSLDLLYRGSKNQRLIDMPATLKSGTIRLYAPPEW